VKVSYSRSFVKDMERLKGIPAFERIKAVAFETIPSSEALEDIPNLK
jgi:hypothetical protein